MENYQTGIIIALLCVSIAVLFIPSALFCVNTILAKLFHKSHKQSSINRMLIVSLCLIVSLWCLIYSVSYFGIISEQPNTITLTWWEEIANSLLFALKTFGINENYTIYMNTGKQMILQMFGDNNVLQALYGLYVSALNIIAPVTSGAIIFDILVSIFPKIKLFLLDLLFWKEKYYFSELNEASFALTKSICNVKTSYLRKPVIVFADCNANDKDEKINEFYLEAKHLGVIFINENLLNIRKNKFGKKKFFLMSESEAQNLQLLSEFANTSNAPYLKKSEIFFFTAQETYVQVEKTIREKLIADFKFTNDDLPVLNPVNCYRNIISNLLVDIPLFEPLISKKRNPDGSQDLTLSILGSGQIGTEMFLSAYWFGQLLNCNLKINIISGETEEEFCNKIDYINPEILHTTVKNDPILRINRNGDTAKIYCDINYINCDVKSSDFIECITNHEKHILDSDYFFVALGSDEENISVANTIRNYVGEHHIKCSSSLKTVITYVVYNSEVAEVLNKKKHFSFINNDADVYIQAVGSLNDVYSVRNIFMSEYEPFLTTIYDAYNKIQEQEKRAEVNKERIKDEYKYWANLARSMHIKYKMYSFGMINASVFNFTDYSDYQHNIKKTYEEYKKIISGEIVFKNPEQEKEHLALLHKMAWLEHRRWNAFMRIKGFRATKDYDLYAVSGNYGSYKQMDLKLHPCLVECDFNGIKGSISYKGDIDEKSLLKCSDNTDFDLLDDLTYDLYRKRYNNYDFKLYDYPMFEIKFKED